MAAWDAFDEGRPGLAIERADAAARQLTSNQDTVPRLLLASALASRMYFTFDILKVDPETKIRHDALRAKREGTRSRLAHLAFNFPAVAVERRRSASLMSLLGGRMAERDGKYEAAVERYTSVRRDPPPLWLRAQTRAFACAIKGRLLSTADQMSEELESALTTQAWNLHEASGIRRWQALHALRQGWTEEADGLLATAKSLGRGNARQEGLNDLAACHLELVRGSGEFVDHFVEAAGACWRLGLLAAVEVAVEAFGEP